MKVWSANHLTPEASVNQSGVGLNPIWGCTCVYTVHSDLLKSFVFMSVTSLFDPTLLSKQQHCNISLHNKIVIMVLPHSHLQLIRASMPHPSIGAIRETTHLPSITVMLFYRLWFLILLMRLLMIKDIFNSILWKNEIFMFIFWDDENCPHPFPLPHIIMMNVEHIQYI